MEVIRTDSNGIATLTLNRPEKRNAISLLMIDQLQSHLDQIRLDDGIRVLVLTGAGKTFCAGMDLERVQQIVVEAKGNEVAWHDTLLLEKLFETLYGLPKPTIALVNGAAVAGGAGLVSLCDLAIATTNAKLGYPEVRRGLVAGLVMPHLLRLVGERMARYLLLTGELIGAEEALRTGLINAVVNEENLQTEGNSLAESLIQGGPKALATTKEMLRKVNPLVDKERVGNLVPLLTQESLQGLKAFFDKQDPPWFRNKS